MFEVSGGDHERRRQSKRLIHERVTCCVTRCYKLRGVVENLITLLRILLGKKYGRFTTKNISKYEHFTRKISETYPHLVSPLWFLAISAFLSLFFHQLFLSKDEVKAAYEYVSGRLDDWRNVVVHFAACGVSGSGKSTFINLAYDIFLHILLGTSMEQLECLDLSYCCHSCSFYCTSVILFCCP